jgi:hypothetical protein
MVTFADSEEGWSWSRPFMQYMWLGDEDRGLCWSAELDDGRRLQDQAKAAALTRTGRELALRLKLIAATVAVEQPLRLEFGAAEAAFLPTGRRRLAPRWSQSQPYVIASPTQVADC